LASAGTTGLLSGDPYLSFAAADVFCYSIIMDQEILSFSQSAQHLGIKLNELQLTQFDIYQKELLKWNAKINLISEKSAREIETKHFLDSLTAGQFIDNPSARIVDIGCGAGFPGLPLKIAAPELALYLLETNRKKMSFLKYIVRTLNLSSTFFLHDRMENFMKDNKWKGFFNIVISRAAFKLPELMPCAAFFLAKGGKFIALKGFDIEEEFSHGAALADRYGFSELLQHDINLIFLGNPRKIIIGEKIK
jgi:16S rRNA (guanine527-N7)-methyltransferase